MSTSAPPLSLDSLPQSLQQTLLLEWMSPATVLIAVRASAVLRRAVLALPKGYQVDRGQQVSDRFVRWFRENDQPLSLVNCVLARGWRSRIYFRNDKIIHWVTALLSDQVTFSVEPEQGQTVVYDMIDGIIDL